MFRPLATIGTVDTDFLDGKSILEAALEEITHCSATHLAAESINVELPKASRPNHARFLESRGFSRAKRLSDQATHILDDEHSQC